MPTPRGPGLRLGIIVGAVVLSSAARAGAPRYQLRLEAGSEYDSNVFRLDKPDGESVDIEASPLARLGARLELGWSRTKREALDFRGFLGTKLFTTEEAQTENVVVTQANGGYSLAIPDRALIVGLRGNHYNADNYQVFGDGRPVPGRTFSTNGLLAEATLVGRPSQRATFGAGYRWFSFKPDEDFDWEGVSGGAAYRAVFWLGDQQKEPDVASIDVSATYRVDRRDYQGLAFRNQCTPDEMLEPACSIPTDVGRVDIIHMLSGEVSYTGERIYGLRYQVQLNDSNSFTQSYIRHRLDLSLTSELYWGIFATARGTLQFNQFLDSLLITQDVNSQTFVSIDDENRNSVNLILSREMSGNLTIEGRYRFFSNEFATRELDFRRQTIYLGIVLSTGS